jgi:C-terminal processing protease CtpA/Prc
MLPSDLQELREEGERIPAVPPRAFLHPSGVGVVTIPGCGPGGMSSAGQRYASDLDAVLRSVAPRACGWIFDLADNDGGNMFPMLAGLVGVLGVGRQCGFRDTGNRLTWVDATKDAVGIGSNTFAKVPNASPLAPRPTAILVGPETASSGEFTALCLIGRTGAGIFGTPTAGYLTGVEVKELPSGGAVGVTGVTAVDHLGAAWPDRLMPDVECSPSDVDQAAAWITSGAAPFARRVEGEQAG